jgi:hypothetical protein
MGTLIRKPWTLLAVGMVGGLLAALTAVPLVAAHAAEQATDVEFLDEGWWLRYREPLAPVPPSGGIDAIPPDSTEIPRATLRDQTNPYRGEYTRVSAVSGDEEATEAIAAFGLDPFGLADGMPATMTGGTVTFVAAPPESAPQAGDGANGQRNEEGAAMVACLQTDFQAPTSPATTRSGRHTTARSALRWSPSSRSTTGRPGSWTSPRSWARGRTWTSSAS